MQNDAITRLSKAPNGHSFRSDVLAGLSAKIKSIPPRYFYDDKGSLLFSKICDLPGYYLTDCETEIFERHCDEIARFIAASDMLVELGAGDGRKTKILLEALDTAAQKSTEFIPVDISDLAVEALTSDILDDLPNLTVKGIVGEFLQSLTWIRENKPGPKTVLFLGSNIGNFTQDAATLFLTRLWDSLSDGDKLLIGFDLRKPIKTLLAAYDDQEGVTAEFNYNLLERINRELGADFRLDQFEHVASYNFDRHAMESRLVSTTDQQVSISSLGRTFHFQKQEAIFTEFSHKYSIEQIEAFAQRTGFEVSTHFFDEKRYFCDSLWTVRKNG